MTRLEGGREHRKADVACSLRAASIGRHVLLFHEAEDVFEHDDRVVDHDADHQHQRQHRDLVQREAHRVHQRVGRQ